MLDRAGRLDYVAPWRGLATANQQAFDSDMYGHPGDLPPRAWPSRPVDPSTKRVTCRPSQGSPTDHPVALVDRAGRLATIGERQGYVDLRIIHPVVRRVQGWPNCWPRVRRRLCGRRCLRLMPGNRAWRSSTTGKNTGATAKRRFPSTSTSRLRSSKGLALWLGRGPGSGCQVPTGQVEIARHGGVGKILPAAD